MLSIEGFTMKTILPASVVLLALASSGIACGSSTTAPNENTPEETEVFKAPELGKGDHSAESVSYTTIATAKLGGVDLPRDLAFNPMRPDELWIVNNGDESVTIVKDASKDERKPSYIRDVASSHFMLYPTSLAFGTDETTFGIKGTFATCGESRNEFGTNEETGAGKDFTGPSLWSSDLSIFAKKDPIGLGSHLDMLHNTPLCMGIAHDSDNKYWVVGGLSGAIEMYDFGKDHDIGMDDHSDGQFFQYAKGQLKYEKGVPSHLVVHSGLVYAADTGNGRIVKLDPGGSTRGAAFRPKERMGTSVVMNGGTLSDVVPSDAGHLVKPSGLAIRNDILYVSDNENSRISAFSLEGERLNYLDTGLPKGSLAGIAFGPDDKLYFVDILGNRVLRIDEKN